LVEALPAPPGGVPLANLVASGHGDRVVVVGVTCDEGTGPDDVGAVRCAPGRPAMVVLEADRSWRTIPLPPHAVEPGGFVGDQHAYALADGRLAYTVQPDGGSNRTDGWITDDDGRSWDRLDVPAGSYLCATRGVLVALHDEIPYPDAAGGSERPAVPFATTVETLDAQARTWTRDDAPPPEVAVRPGRSEGTCTPEAGYVSFELTDQGRAFVTYLPGTGWRVHEGPEWKSRIGVATSAGTDVVIGDLEDPTVTILDVETNRSRTVALREAGHPVAIVGADKFLISPLGSSQLDLVEL
jgi:hypothetical protein